MKAIDKHYLNLGYWFMLLILLTIAGFYPTYFAIWSFEMPSVMHIHAFLMSVWITILIIQPILIKQRKYKTHRTIGRLTYILVPLILLSAYLMTRYTYFKFMHDLEQSVVSGTSMLTPGEIVNEAKIYVMLPVLYFSLFAIFYVLAITNRREPMVHAQFMIAAALTLLGPTVDRIVFNMIGSPKIGGMLPIESVAFAIELIVLGLLAIYHFRKNHSLKTIGVCVAIYFVGHVLYFTVGTTQAYRWVVGVMMM